MNFEEAKKLRVEMGRLKADEVKILIADEMKRLQHKEAKRLKEKDAKTSKNDDSIRGKRNRDKSLVEMPGDDISNGKTLVNRKRRYN